MIWFVAGCIENGFPDDPAPVYDVLPQPGLGHEWTTAWWEGFVPQDVDVLITVDVSGSMGNHHDYLVSQADRFVALAGFYGFRYHVGVVATCETYYGCGEVTWRRANGRNAGRVVRELLEDAVPVDKEIGIEWGAWAAYSALASPPEGFLRGAGVPLYLFVVSDEEDQSPANAYDLLYAQMWGEWARRGGFMRPEPQTEGSLEPWVNFGAVVQMTTLSASYYDNCFGTYGGRYVDFADRTDGNLADICGFEWDDILDQTFTDMVPDVWIYLDRQPVVRSIEPHVLVDGEDIVPGHQAWKYEPDENAVRVSGFLVEDAWVEYAVDY